MNIALIILNVLFAGSLFAIYKIKINAYEKKHDDLISWAQEKAEELQIKTNEINNTSDWLDQVAKELASQRRFNDKLGNKLKEKDKEVKEIHADNIILLESNKETLKENKMQLYNIREASIYAWKQYQSISDMLRNLLVFDDGDNMVFEHIRSSLQVVNNSMHQTSNYFKAFFRMTPEEYLSKKNNIRGRKPDGSDYVSDSKAN